MVSPFVQRNLDHAQYAQPRGSQYEGPILTPEELGHPLDGYAYASCNCVDCTRIRQGLSIHLEELDFARAKNAHCDHFTLQGFRLDDCRFCMELVR